MDDKVGYIDATDGALGRISSTAAKRLLAGETIVIVNAQNAVVTGSRAQIMAKYRERRVRGSVRRGPFFPRMPHRLLKRAVRGMLPYHKPRGRSAYERLTVHIGVPSDLKGQQFEHIPVYRSRARFMLLGEVSKELGATFITERPNSGKQA